MNKIRFILIVVLALSLAACSGVSPDAARQLTPAPVVPTSAPTAAPVATAAPTVVPTAQPTNVPVAINGQTNGADPSVWNKPQSKGSMVSDGKVVYSQSGKPNQTTLTGTVGENQNLVITSYRFEQKVLIYDNGVVIVIPGPANLNDLPITLTDGAATLVGKDSTQTKLDSVWIDFCRGDRTPDGSAWTYRPWALSNIRTGEFKFPDLKTCFKASDDKYPNNPPAK
jgi:hypothetical protein